MIMIDKKAHSYGELLIKYENAISWMETFGVKINKTRLVTYGKLFSELDKIKIPEYKSQIAESKRNEVWNALYEIGSFTFIHEGFKDKKWQVIVNWDEYD